MKTRHLILLLLFVPGCEADGARLFDAAVWLGDHPYLAGFGITLLVPLIAQIPVVGIPISIFIAKFGTAMIPALKAMAEAVEKDKRLDRSVGEAAGVVVGKLADDPDSKVGKVPGLGTVANVAASAIVRESRRQKRASRRLKRRGNFRR